MNCANLARAASGGGLGDPLCYTRLPLQLLPRLYSGRPHLSLTLSLWLVATASGRSVEGDVGRRDGASRRGRACIGAAGRLRDSHVHRWSLYHVWWRVRLTRDGAAPLSPLLTRAVLSCAMGLCIVCVSGGRGACVQHGVQRAPPPGVAYCSHGTARGARRRFWCLPAICLPGYI